MDISYISTKKIDVANKSGDGKWWYNQHVKKGFTYQMKIEGESSNIKLWSLNT